MVIPFLDCLVTRDDDNKQRTTVYRKPHTDRLLDQASYNSTSHKATTNILAGLDKASATGL